MSSTGRQFVSRAGEKLSWALDAFGIDVRGLLCADFGCNVGGFTDCLLDRGAAKVYAIDAGYGQLAWRLRKDARVVVMERTNALYVEPPERVDLVTIDVAWTPQSLAAPAARRWINDAGRIVSLLKPHYELAKMKGRKPSGKLDSAEARQVCLDVCRRLGSVGCEVAAVARSTLLGKGGNEEFLLLVRAGGTG